MPTGRRRAELIAQTASFLAEAFPGRILPFDSACAALYAEIRVARESSGKPIMIGDAMIAATARVYGAVIATRNVSDLSGCGVQIQNPWRSA
ncbi:MAG: PIN domain-containing protein [Bradyrhizobium sp.]